MDRIIQSISEIENGSVKIMADANARKAEIAAQLQRETEEFDSALEHSTNERIETLRHKLEQEMKEKLMAQKDSAANFLNDLEHHYEERRTSYIEQLFKEMTGV